MKSFAAVLGLAAFAVAAQAASPKAPLMPVTWTSTGFVHAEMIAEDGNTRALDGSHTLAFDYSSGRKDNPLVYMSIMIDQALAASNFGKSIPISAEGSVIGPDYVSSWMYSLQQNNGSCFQVPRSEIPNKAIPLAFAQDAFQSSGLYVGQFLTPYDRLANGFSLKNIDSGYGQVTSLTMYFDASTSQPLGLHQLMTYNNSGSMAAADDDDFGPLASQTLIFWFSLPDLAEPTTMPPGAFEIPPANCVSPAVSEAATTPVGQRALRAAFASEAVTSQRAGGALRRLRAVPADAAPKTRRTALRGNAGPVPVNAPMFPNSFSYNGDSNVTLHIRDQPSITVLAGTTGAVDYNLSAIMPRATYGLISQQPDGYNAAAQAALGGFISGRIGVGHTGADVLAWDLYGSSTPKCSVWPVAQGALFFPQTLFQSLGTYQGTVTTPWGANAYAWQVVFPQGQGTPYRSATLFVSTDIAQRPLGWHTVLKPGTFGPTVMGGEVTTWLSVLHVLDNAPPADMFKAPAC